LSDLTFGSGVFGLSTGLDVAGSFGLSTVVVVSGDFPSGDLASDDFKGDFIDVGLSGFDFGFDCFEDFGLHVFAGTCFGETGACLGAVDTGRDGVDLPEAGGGDFVETNLGGVDFPDVGPLGTGLPEGGIDFIV
jgi:hypothetical protein